MTPEQILKGNVMIAEFMGGVYKLSPITLELDKERIYIGEDEAMFFTTPRATVFANNYRLRFHEDWNWLMEVVDKIERYGFSVEIGENKCSIINRSKYEYTNSIDSIDTGNKLLSTYLAVVQFLEWYNQTKASTSKTGEQ